MTDEITAYYVMWKNDPIIQAHIKNVTKIMFEELERARTNND